MTKLLYIPNGTYIHWWVNRSGDITENVEDLIQYNKITRDHVVFDCVEDVLRYIIEGRYPKEFWLGNNILFSEQFLRSGFEIIYD